MKFWPPFPRGKKKKKKVRTIWSLLIKEAYTLSPQQREQLNLTWNVTVTAWKNDGEREREAKQTEHSARDTVPKPFCAFLPLILLTSCRKQSPGEKVYTLGRTLPFLPYQEYSSLSRNGSNRQTHKGMHKFSFSVETKPTERYLQSVTRRMASLDLQHRRYQGPEVQFLAQGTFIFWTDCARPTHVIWSDLFYLGSTVLLLATSSLHSNI